MDIVTEIGPYLLPVVGGLLNVGGEAALVKLAPSYAQYSVLASLGVTVLLIVLAIHFDSAELTDAAKGSMGFFAGDAVNKYFVQGGGA